MNFNSIRDDVIWVITPHVGDPQQRQALISRAFGDHAVFSQVDQSGDAQTFTANMVQVLVQRGHDDLLIDLLKVIQGQVGVRHQARITDLIHRLNTVEWEPGNLDFPGVQRDPAYPPNPYDILPPVPPMPRRGLGHRLQRLLEKLFK